MGVTKSELFSDKKNRLAGLFKVLAHPARLAILQYIINEQQCICTDLVEELGLAQSTISVHLKELKASGIIKGEVEGRSVCYCIDNEVWAEFSQQINLFLGQNTSFSTCC